MTKSSGGGVYCKHRVNKYGVIAVKKMFKKNYKIVLGIIIGGIISGVGVYAATTLSSSDITYDNSKSGLTSTNLNGAIDELYEKVNNKPPCKVIKGTGTQTSDEIKCGTEEFYVLYPSGDSITVLAKYPIEGGCSKQDPGGYCIAQMETPSYAQNKNCGETILCGNPDITQYKSILINIGLSDTISVSYPSIEDMNRAGCLLLENLKYTDTGDGIVDASFSGNCSSTNLSGIKMLALKNSHNLTVGVHIFPVLVAKDGPIVSHYNQNTETKQIYAMVTIPLEDIIM